MLAIFGYISGILAIICYLPYIKDTLNLKTKPQRASWFIWTVLGGISFFSQLAKGATNSLWLVGLETVGVTVVFLLSLKYGVGGWNKRDGIALVIALLGLVFWYFTKEAAIALFIVIFIDAIGDLLTVQKAYLDPASETLAIWILLSYPLYILVSNFAVAGAIFLGRARLVKARA